MPNIRPIQNAAGDAAEFLNAALRGTNLREQMAEAAAREIGLNTAMKFDPWTTPAMGVDTFALTPSYAVPTGRADPWRYRQPDIGKSASAFAGEMGPGKTINPQLVTGGSSAHKLPPIAQGADLGGMEERALATLVTPEPVSLKPVLKNPQRQLIPDEQIRYVDEVGGVGTISDTQAYRDDWQGDPEISMAELEALAPVEDYVSPINRVATIINDTSVSSPPPQQEVTSPPSPASFLPDLGVPTTSTAGTQGILPGILISENAGPIEQFTEGLRRGFTKQMGDSGNYAQSIFTSPPRPQDETDLNLLGKAGVALGAIGGDISGHGSRKFLWNVHPEDVANTVGKSFLADAGAPRIAQLAGAYGTALALGIGSGNYNPLNLSEGGRAAGYQANNPTEEDPRQSASPVYDMVIERGLLGRKGKLLPWEQFHEERPDVSYETYAKYQDYQRNKDPGLLSKATLGLAKGTMEGINGPEVSVMGYGITPMGAAAALGTLGAVAYGAKKVAALR